MQLSSSHALQVYEQVFWDVDRPLGETISDDAAPVPVTIPDGSCWFVRPFDRHPSATYLATLAEEIRTLAIPGLSLAGCRHLAGDAWVVLRTCTHLEVLDLFNTPLDDAGIEQLAALGELRSLNLAGTKITDGALATIARFPQLERLHLGWTAISDAGLAQLARAPRLQALDLRGTAITDRGLGALTACPQLTALGLQETAVGDAGLAQLAPLASRLQRLDLGYTRVTENSVARLLELAQLRCLVLRATTIPRQRDAELVARLPSLASSPPDPHTTRNGLIR